MKRPIIRTLLACAPLLLAAACGEEAPAPVPAAQPAPPAAPQPVAQAQPQNAALAAPQAAADPDADLAARVKKALEHSSGALAQGVDVTAKGGAVSLFGTVASGAGRSSAEKIAASVSGVTSVVNKLVVVKGS